ncbi:BCCT family transporter [Aeromicrobium sp.]|uniref:BCCT family transporter n=1 Tax=Aeromicrobium sp. TaxID=1871063 RepID=UPI003D6A2B21
MTDIHEPAGAKTTTGESRRAIDTTVFGVAAVLAVAFVLVGAIWPEWMDENTTAVLGWVTGNLGWLFVLTSAGFVVFSAYLAASRFGNVRLGSDDSEPEFSTVSWVSMMFATGMGIGLMFWGVAEPLTHLNAPPLGESKPGSADAAADAMQFAFFHWGFHPWAMYAVIGLAIGYFAYRKGYGNTISATFRPLLGRRASEGPGKTIDVIAIFATLFGSATSLGLGALQITGGIDDVFGEGGGSKALAVAVIAVLTACFVLSAVSGVERGIKYLSNANAIAAALLAFFLFVVGPTVFILSTFTQTMGDYLTHLPSMAFSTGVYDTDASSWLSGWTIFYWAWWISWTPFVGMFIARISKGRTIREFVVYVILVPSLVSFVWFAILGGAAIDLQLNQGWKPPMVDGAVAADPSLFAVLREYPLGAITVALAIFLIAIFFVTGADAASIVMGMLSQNGAEEPRRYLVIFWGVATGAVAAVLLWAGGLAALQRLVILVAGPFMLILIGMCVSLIKELRKEPPDAMLGPRIRRAVEHADRFPDGP